MKKFGHKQMHEIERNGHTVLYSYSTPVAYHRDGQRPRLTDTYYSVTTTQHINYWLNHHDFSRENCVIVPQSEIDSIAA